MKTISENKAHELLRRGGPYTPAEYAELANVDPVEAWRARFRVIPPSEDPRAADLRRQIEARYADRLAEAQRALDEAVQARERAVAEYFQARDVAMLAEGSAFFGGAGGVRVLEPAGTPEQAAAARKRLKAAEIEWHEAEERERRARAKLTEIGLELNEARRAAGL